MMTGSRGRILLMTNDLPERYKIIDEYYKHYIMLDGQWVMIESLNNDE